MAIYDRGVYEPSDDVRVFDGSEDEEDVEGSRLPLLIVLALLVLAMFAGVVWLAYTQGVARGRGETPVLTAEAGPARVAPPNSGRSGKPYKGFKIYEQPAPPDDDTATMPAAAPAAGPQRRMPTPAAAQAPKPRPACYGCRNGGAQAGAGRRTESCRRAGQGCGRIACTPSSGPKAAPVCRPSLPRRALLRQPPPSALGCPRHGCAAPIRRGASSSAAAATPGGRQRRLCPADRRLQSQADADAAWKAYKAKHAALLSALFDDVQQADLGDKGIWYRLRIAGFPEQGCRLGPVRPAEGGRRRLLPGQITCAAARSMAAPAQRCRRRSEAFSARCSPGDLSSSGAISDDPDQVQSIGCRHCARPSAMHGPRPDRPGRRAGGAAEAAPLARAPAGGPVRSAA